MDAPRGTYLLSEDQSAYVFPLPPTARVVGHDTGGAARGEGTCPDEADDKLIYSNPGDPAQYLVYRPPYAHTRIADNMFTNAVGPCEIHKYSIRVNGGVPNGWFEYFDTRISLWPGCPDPSNDFISPIPGTELSFTRTADINDIWELEVDFCDPNIGICSDGRACRFVDDAFGSGTGCEDGSECVARTEPVVIPAQVWLRVEFSTNTAGWLVGAPPVVGFSQDRYYHMFTGCDTWFGGYPTHPHASFSAQFYASATCPTHFPAYRADVGQGVAYTDPGGGTTGQLMADDIELVVDSCELSAIEVGTHGIHGRYEIDFDLRILPSDNPIPGTEFHWVSNRKSGVGNLEVARLEFDESVFVPRDFWITWRVNKDDTGLINAGGTQIGGQCRLPDGSACNRYFAWYGPPWAHPGEWSTQVETADDRDAVFSVAVYCHGEEPTGPCCVDQPDSPGQDPVCIDAVPASSCLGGRWLNAEGAPDTIACPASFNLGECENGSACDVVDQDCPDSSCAAGHDCRCEPVDPWAQIGQPPCGTHACCKPDDNCEDLPRDDCVAILEEDTRHPARWNRGDWCGFGDQRCPFFACYDASVACSDCNDPFHECGSDSDCIYWLDDPNATCDIVHKVCPIPKGCSDVWCCDWVCRIPSNQFCCSTGWDCTCRAQSEFCPGPPANDECHEEEPGRGAIAIRLDPAPLPLHYRGFASSNHENATSGPTDICCFKQGTDRLLPGSVWYKFRPEETGSVRIQTCDTPGADDALDSVIQVFAAPFTNIGICDDGSQCSVGNQDCPDDSCYAGNNCPCHDDDERLCQYLEVVACNDDGGESCGPNGKNADVCIPEVVAGELDYVVVGVGANEQLGTYKLTIEQPCDPEDIPPSYSYCEGSQEAFAGPNPYDLSDATLDCPVETCLPRMKNDVWFDYHPTCTGNLIVRTCDTDPATPEEDTTLAVYEGLTCPPPLDNPATPEPEGALLGCNDDAVPSEYAHAVLGMPQTCASVGGQCNVDADCPKICTAGSCTVGTCTIGLDLCTTDGQCDEGRCAHDTCISDGDCDEGVCTHVTCTEDTDCDIGVCTSGDQCSVSLDDCNDGFSCVRAGGCGDGVCDSPCAPGSLVIVPVTNALSYKIRVGGSMGSEPSGDLTITCIEDSCDIQNCPPGEPWCKDCNFNGVIDMCDIFFDPENWKDCQCNYIPDRCEIRFDSSAPGGPFYCVSDCDPDVDENGVPDVCFVGLRELASLLVCFTGEDGGVIDPGCTNLDADNDGDLDLYDFATLRLTGPGVCQWEPWIDR
jgi:hypothetical protein